MKKNLFLVFFAFVAIWGQAQVLQKTAVFDFSNPESLSTPITPSSTGGGGVSLENVKLVDGSIVLSFGRTSTSLPPEIWTYENPNNHRKSYYLRIRSGSSVIFTSAQGATITKIKMEIDGDQGQRGTIFMDDGMQGTFSAWEMTWNNYEIRNEKDTIPVYPSLLSFSTNGSPAQISKIIVSYTVHAVALEATSNLPDLTSPMLQFKNMVLSFPNAKDKISVTGNPVLTVKGNYSDFDSYGTLDTTLKVDSIICKDVYLSVATRIIHDGEFEVVIPEQSFIDADGFMNYEFKQKFAVYESRTTFNRVVVDPPEGDRKSLPGVYKVTFPDKVRLDADVINNPNGGIVLRKDGEVKYPVSLSLDIEDNKTVLFTTEEIPFAEENIGKWTIIIPEGAIHNTFPQNSIHDRWNAKDTLIYNFIDALKEKREQLVNLKAEAKALCELVDSVGYPKNDHGLGAIVNAEMPDTEEAIDDALKQLNDNMKAFYEDKNVKLPITGHWYNFTSVNSKGHELPLSFSYGNDSITLGGTPVAFQIESISPEGVAVFKVKKGEEYRYLHVLLANSDYYITSSKNVTAEKIGIINDLQLSKMLIDGEDQKPVLGLFSIKGSLGVNSQMTDAGKAYSMINHMDDGFISAPLLETDNVVLKFEEEQTNAFRLTETEAPSGNPEVNPINPKAYFASDVINSNTSILTLAITADTDDDGHINDIKKVVLKANAHPLFVIRNDDDTMGEEVTTFTGEKIIEPYDEAIVSNLFNVHVNGLADGKYYLVLTKGTFDYSQNDIPVNDKDLKVGFEIKKSGTSDLDQYGSLENNWGFIPYLVQGNPVNSQDLVDFIIYMNMDIYPSENRDYNKISLWRPTGSTPIITGRFVPHVQDGKHMVKVAYDTEFPTLDKGDYTFIIERGAYGDENFNKYQKGDASLNPQDCKINRRFFKNVTVDNSVLPTIISNINLLNDNGVYFDLQGRRVNNPAKGVYILNGKKVVIK